MAMRNDPQVSRRPEMLGQTNTGIILDLYSHATPTMQEAAAGACDRLFYPGTGSDVRQA